MVETTMPTLETRKATTPEARLAELKSRLREIGDLNYAGAVLNWDQATYMPKGGAGARSRQAALLSRLAHEKSVDPELGRLIDALSPMARACLSMATRRA